jgi:hypothetical protein
VKIEEPSEAERKWKKIHYRRYTLRVPKSKHNATRFTVHYKVSAWAANVLKF